MAFNHYAKMKQILLDESPGWYIKRLDKPTVAQNFAGEKIRYDHYYRIYSADGSPIKYCKFQKLDKLASVLKHPTENLPIID